jgi:hypothetical protein
MSINVDSAGGLAEMKTLQNCFLFHFGSPVCQFCKHNELIVCKCLLFPLGKEKRSFCAPCKEEKSLMEQINPRLHLNPLQEVVFADFFRSFTFVRSRFDLNFVRFLF